MQANFIIWRTLWQKSQSRKLLTGLKRQLKGGGGQPLNDSAFWYLSDEGVDGLFELEQSEDYKKTFITDITKDMLAIAEYIAVKYAGKSNIIFTDWGCGNGQISRVVTQDLIRRGFGVTYMPVDISEKELQIASAEHKSENIKPVLCLFENLKDIFPLSVPKDTVVVHGFLGGTVGNFKKQKINDIIKSVKEEVIVHMPIVEIKNERDRCGVIKGYENKGTEKFILGPFKVCGFRDEDFVLNENGLRYKVRFENGMIKTSVTLAKNIEFEDVMLNKGTVYDITESRKFNFNQFREFIAPSCGSDVKMISKTGAIAICPAGINYKLQIINDK